MVTLEEMVVVWPPAQWMEYTTSAPPLVSSGFHAMCRKPSPASTSRIFPTRSMGSSGVAPDDVRLQSEKPTALWARTWNRYDVPLVRPVMVQEVAPHRVVWPNWS